ncbi:MAG: hypothetical protein LH475_10410 [Cryobacterium sp.]|nr:MULTISPECIES: ammonium transporter [unclassified Cryobacterium]MCY7405018.1 hypothetical protein [Cryobacterium sp.]MEC5154132.1 ammonia channel protein AmtB [Cryobacterium sp. CAN_C3]
MPDFASGTVVRMKAGASGLELALMLGNRVEFRKGLSKPHPTSTYAMPSE